MLDKTEHPSLPVESLGWCTGLWGERVGWLPAAPLPGRFLAARFSEHCLSSGPAWGLEMQATKSSASVLPVLLISDPGVLAFLQGDVFLFLKGPTCSPWRFGARSVGTDQPSSCGPISV